MYSTDPNLFWRWAEDRLETNFWPDAQFIGRVRDNGTPWGCVVFEQFTSHNAVIHFCGDRGWITKALLKACHAYAFRQLGLSRLTGLVDEHDRRTLAIDKRIGFVEEGRLRNGLGDRDIIVLGIKPEEFRYS